MNDRKILLVLVVGWVLAIQGVVPAGTTATLVTISEQVDSFAEWDQATHTIAVTDFTGHITARNQSQTADGSYTLYANCATTILPSAVAGSPDYSGILTYVSGSTYTLTTSYKLTGAGLTAPDGSWKAAGSSAGQFFNASNTYAIAYVLGTGSYSVHLQVQATGGSTPPPAATYTCRVTLTATF